MGQLVNVTSTQNTLGGVLVGPAALMPADFSIRRGYEGPQIIIEWGDPYDPGSVLTTRLLRRRFGYPQDENDGDIIFTGPPGAQKLSDLSVVDCVCYYYKVFVFATNGDILVSNDTEAEIIPLQTGFFGPKLWELQPEVYKLNDKGLEDPTSPKLALAEGAAAGDVEVYNFDEDGSVLRGPLQRMLRFFGPALDEAKGLVDCFRNQLDVDDSCTAELEGLAALLGLNLNKELSPEKMRDEVRLQVANLKSKGTIPGLISRLRAVSGLTAVVEEQHNNVLLTNDPARTTYGFTPAEAANIFGPGDLIYRVNGRPADVAPHWLWFNVFIEVDIATYVLNEPTARKMCIVIDESSPACHKGFLHITTAVEEDSIPFTFAEEATDAYSTLHEETFPINLVEEVSDEEVENAAKWLIISDPTKVLNTADYTAVFASPTLP